ncbi:CDP-glycerol glycerophosphotransferase family protein [Macrococcus capreoli]|uniref:CDP-glycerol glycerophosphotransferase family protein n=1 Tax=Macrococcus capreoli TaxID=2982690 RepID=UPI003F42A1B6
MQLKNILLFNEPLLQVMPSATTLEQYIHSIEEKQKATQKAKQKENQQQDFTSVHTVLILPAQYNTVQTPFETYYYHHFTEMIDLLNTLITADDFTYVYFPNAYQLDMPFQWPVQSSKALSNDLSQYVFSKAQIKQHRFNANSLYYYPLAFIYDILYPDITDTAQLNLYNDLLCSRDIPTSYKCKYLKALLQYGSRVISEQTNQQCNPIELYIDRILKIQMDPSNDELLTIINVCKEDLIAYYRIKHYQRRFNAFIPAMLQQLPAVALINDTRTALRAVKRIIKDRTKLDYTAYEMIQLHLPVRNNTFIFESFNGRGYSDNPKYIYEYMYQHYPDYQYYWVVNDLNTEIPGPAIKVERLSKAYYKAYATCEYWISNTRLPSNLKKRANQTYIQTWHGTPLKKLVLDMESVKLPNTTTLEYKLKFMKEAERWDYLISPNDYSTAIFTRCFNVPTDKILTTGYPRNEMLALRQDDQHYCTSIRHRIGLADHKNVILYAPTWRDADYNEDGDYAFNLKLDIDAFLKHTDDDTVLLLRLHYLIAAQLDLPDHPRIINVSDYDDIADLYLISDVLITDYSSVFFDYSILNRPVIFFSYDLEVYKDELRGFYMDYYTQLPGPICTTNEELFQQIYTVLNKDYDNAFNHKAFYTDMNRYEDGHASSRIIDAILKHNNQHE